MPELNIALDLGGLRQPFRKALHTAARLGVAAVEIDARGEVSPQQLSQTGLRQLRKMLEDLNLRVAAVKFRTRRGYGVSEELDRRVEATKAVMQLAYALGSSVVVNHLGRVPTAEGDQPRRTMLLEVLGDLGQHGLHVGAQLAAETGTESGADLAALLEELPDGSLGVDFNPANLLLNDFSPGEALEALARWVLHVHATDAVRDLAGGSAHPVPLGQGAVDFPSLLGTLAGGGYRGYYTIRPSGDIDPLREVSETVAYLRGF